MSEAVWSEVTDDKCDYKVFKKSCNIAEWVFFVSSAKIERTSRVTLEMLWLIASVSGKFGKAQWKQIIHSEESEAEAIR